MPKSKHQTREGSGRPTNAWRRVSSRWSKNGHGEHLSTKSSELHLSVKTITVVTEFHRRYRSVDFRHCLEAVDVVFPRKLDV
jgi:hypothetical protein